MSHVDFWNIQRLHVSVASIYPSYHMVNLIKGACHHLDKVLDLFIGLILLILLNISLLTLRNGIVAALILACMYPCRQLIHNSLCI